MTITKAILADMDEWTKFAAENREALEEQYGTVESALQHCQQGGLRMGGAAPIVDVIFADDAGDPS